MVGAQFSPGVGSTAPIERLVKSSGPKGNALKGAGLLAVAVVSGLLWWLIRHDDAGTDQAGTPGQNAPAGEFIFSVAAAPVKDTDCAANSYGDIQSWFAGHPCTQLSRALYVTESGGARALVSVAVVTMHAPETAQQFKAITDTDGTGNVKDLVTAGTAKIPGAPKVASGEYTSRVSGQTATIVEANLFDGKKNEALLKRIAADALRLGDQLR